MRGSANEVSMSDEAAKDQASPDVAQPQAAEPTEAPSSEAGDLADDALKAAQEAISSLKNETSSGQPKPLSMPDFKSNQGTPMPSGISLLSDVNLNVKIELGRTRMLVEDVLKLSEGAVVELDKLAGDPVDIYVNDRPVARGEVLVLNDNFCVRINEILAPIAAEGGSSESEQGQAA